MRKIFRNICQKQQQALYVWEYITVYQVLKFWKVKKKEGKEYAMASE